VSPEVAARMEAVLHEPFGNPSSDHWAGTSARVAVETARAEVAALLGCDAGEVVFTSGGSEANNHAIKGAFFATRVEHPHIITTQVEHPAVVGPCRFWNGSGRRSPTCRSMRSAASTLMMCGARSRRTRS
jgi:cysteine desulfurase